MEITRRALLQLYIKEKKSLSEIGQIFGKNPKTISNYLKKFGIKARPFSTKGLKVWLGRVHSEETRDKIRQAHLGKKLSREHRLKVIKTLEHGKGEKNLNWKGGKIITDQGYVWIRVNKRYFLEHRKVIEKSLGRKLSKNEHVHHLNSIKVDNRIENLKIMSPTEHSKLHREKEKRIIIWL